MAAFRDGPRAARLAEALGVGFDPTIQPGLPVRRAIEVYPHPALVALFGLDFSLKYKARSRRPLEDRRGVFHRLMDYIESLTGFEPPLKVTGRRWNELRAAVHSAPGGAALDRLEDEFDAYVCAYVALYYWTHGLERCRVAGDATRGYIVTPVSAEQGGLLDALAAVMNGPK